MAKGRLHHLLRHVRGLAAAEDAAARPDRALLERFVQNGDEGAFAALVQRHGPMVLGVCRRVLRHDHDADDAFQAAFLVLARRAASIRKKASLPSWLHGVAYRVAAHLRRQVARRHAREGPAVDVPQAGAPDVTWREVRAVLDAELRRLPERFRAPVLLCCVEGKTRDEAARELGWSLGTVRGRLERGRQLLRARLARRGLALSAALLGALLTRDAGAAALPAALAAAISRAAVHLASGRGPGVGLVPARVTALMEGVLKAMAMTRLKAVAAVLLMAALAGLAAGPLTAGLFSARPPAGAGAAGPDGARPAQAADVPLGGGRVPDRPGAAGEPAPGQAASLLNLRKLALAMHAYADQHAHFPPPAIYSGEVGAGAGSLLRQPAAGPGGAAPAGGPSSGGGPPAGPGGAGSASPGSSSGPPGLGGGAGGGSAPSGGPGGGGPGLVVAKVVGQGGKALLSWRVALLPYLGEAGLYRQFRLDEPWDGPHNKKLLRRMPKVYAPPGARTREPYVTHYQVFVGEHAAFESHRAMRFPVAFVDGTSNTLLIAEAKAAVPWTKPQDLPFAADEPLPDLGGLFPGVFNAALADGTVAAFSARADPDVLRAAITRDGGEAVDLDRIKAPASRREAELRRQNERLRQDLDREGARLEELRLEKKLLEGKAGGAAAERLSKENERLEELLRRSREEAGRLEAEIRRLRRPGEGRPNGPQP
jgi:RNA polymerase sigma factor (sigma-70 family)